MEAKETLGDGCGRNYANSQSANQNRQDAISRVSAVLNSARGPEVRALTVWRLKHTVTSTVQAAKEWQRQSQLTTTASGGTCMTACALHKQAQVFHA